MKDEHFQQLVESLKEALAIERGEIPPARVVRYERRADGSLERTEVDPAEYQRERISHREDGSGAA